MKQSQLLNNTAAFFPNYFKKIGLGVIVATFATMVALKFLEVDWAANQKEFYGVLLFNLLILGLFFIAWSKDKFEDEMSMQNRLKALGSSIMTAVFYIILSPFVDLLFQEPINKVGAQQLMMFILFMYIIFYKMQKRSA